MPRPRPVSLLAVLVPLAAGAVVLLATRHGAGISADSSLYVGAAESVLRGEGFRMPFGYEGPAPLTHFPPLYPLLLAAGGAGAGWARVLGAVLFAATVALAGAALRRYAPGRPGAALAAMLLVACSLDLLYLHLMTWSEPLYLFLATGSLMLVAEHLRAPSPRLLLLAAAACAGAWLTRYAGAAVVAAGALGILLAPSPLPRGRRLGDALLFGAAASLPMALWLLRGALLAGSATNRTLAFHPPGRATLAQGLATATAWVVPPAVPGRRWLFLALAAALAWGALRLLRREAAAEGGVGEGTRALPWLLVLHLALYALLLLVSLTWVDASTPLDFRILAPALLSALLLGACAGARDWDASGARRALATAAVVVVALFAWRTGAWARGNAGDAQGYASRAWRASPTVRAVRALPAGAEIHTNLPEAVHLLAGRESRLLPPRRSPLSRLPDARFPDALAALACRRGAYVVLFAHVDRPHLASARELHAAARLRPVARGRDGAVLRVEPGPGCRRAHPEG